MDNLFKTDSSLMILKVLPSAKSRVMQCRHVMFILQVPIILLLINLLVCPLPTYLT